MKFLLIPFTTIAWFLIIYFALWLSFNAAIFIINQSWIIIFIAFLFMFGIITLVTTSIPNLISQAIKKLYKNNKLTNILHALAGLLGVIWFVLTLLTDQPKMVIRENLLYNRVKIIVLFFPLAGLFIGLLYTSISMIFDKKTK